MQCNAIKKKDHECFMKVCKTHTNALHPTIYFYDFETCVNSEGYMVPFYCVVQKVCAQCDEKPFIKTYEHFLPHPTDSRCDILVDTVDCCWLRQYVLEKNKDDIVDDLVDFMLEQPKNSVWVANNGGRFDSIFLLWELLVQRKIVPKVIMNGNKIMCMELEEQNLKVIDSYLFLSMRLSKFH